MKKESKPPVQAVLFDLGNVLIYYDAWKAARRFARRSGIPLTKIWLHFFTSPMEKAYTRGEISSFEFFRHARNALKVPMSYSEFKEYWNDIFWENKEMKDLLKALKKKYPLYLISNTNALHFNHIKRHHGGLLKHFDRLFPSHEMGHRKPEKMIYEKVLKRIKLQACETVFIDDMQPFVRGARECGMHAIRFKDRDQLIQDLRKLGIQF